MKLGLANGAAHMSLPRMRPPRWNQASPRSAIRRTLEQIVHDGIKGLRESFGCRQELSAVRAPRH